MAKFKQAPQFFAKVNKHGVPVRALVVSMLFSMISLIAEVIAEDTVYLFLVYFIGGSNIFMYTTICVSEYRFRRKYIKEGGDVKDLNFKVLQYPLVPILGVIAFMCMLAATIIDPGERIAVYVCAPAYLAIYLAAHFYIKKHGNVEAANIEL